MANDFITDEHTEVLQMMIREVETDTDNYIGSQFLPTTSVMARKIRVDILEATGGMTLEHAIGSDGKYIQQGGNRTFEFEGGAYKEALHFDEDKILHLRELGKNDRSLRGVQQYVNNGVRRLQRRLQVRMEYLRWQTLISGGYSYMGKTVSFGIPSGNRATLLGAKWSLDGTSANASAKPLVDWRYWTQGGYAPFRKYKIKSAIMNPNTARFFLDNATVQSFIATRFGSDNFAKYDENGVLGFAIPGSPPVTVYDGTYQTESVNSAGKLVVSDATYMLPDGYIFFPIQTPDNDPLGEMVMTPHLVGGSYTEAATGAFLTVDDHVATGTKGGPGNPFFDIWAGFHGGPKLDRPFDVLTAYVL